jgi:Ca2+-transporting ATPase
LFFLFLLLEQESKAEAALEALQAMSEPTATVLRDGRVTEVESSSIVPGDILVLETGKRIAADVRLVETQGLSCGEMALTGTVTFFSSHLLSVLLDTYTDSNPSFL